VRLSEFNERELRVQVEVNLVPNTSELSEY